MELQKQFVAEKDGLKVMFDAETLTVEFYQKLDGRWVTVAMTSDELKAWSDTVVQLVKGART